jgi:hypothetical protein
MARPWPAATPTKFADAYSLATPYGTVTVSQGGRSVAFELYSDVRQSMHTSALFSYLQRLRQKGVSRFNTDHIHINGRDRTLDLNRGKARLDLIYEQHGKLVECELKTRREIGLEVTAQQLIELTKHCERLHLLVPRGCLEEAATILGMLNLDHKIIIEQYDFLEEDESD